ncbi:hypothetical protein ALC56_08457 [Trachymyrmex septentrionalis]|uniref:Uncharacterized protein n=1 Tax=Trachymyrmex septentrionalis TaxID=34720 RepID=A0A195F8F8_9HYME|nr:hypothetical protein ALC56_08457 [Trachymyrmex septentrionalis]
MTTAWWESRSIVTRGWDGKGRRGLARGGRGSVTVTSSRAHSRGRAIGRWSECRFQSTDLGAENWSGQRFPTKSGARSLEARKLLDHMCRRSCQPACLNEIISG